MTRTVPQHWLLFAGPGDTGLAVQLEPEINKNGVITSFTAGPFGKSFDIELKTSENDNSSLNDAYGDLENSAKNGGSCGYAFLQSEGHLRNEATFRFQFEKEYLKGDKLQNVSGASADLLFGLAVVTAVQRDLKYRPFAATGILSEDRQVQPIEGLQAKICAALNTPALRGSGVIFYPKANDKDIDAELRYEVERAQIALKPVEWLEEAVEYLGIPIQGHWIGNPYRRLDVFEYNHRRIFFGREDVTESLAIKLSDRATLERPSLLILGPSGAGKSSLVQAGLIPELEKKFKEENLSLLYSIFDLKSAANKDIQAIAASIRSSWGLLPGLTALAVSNASKQQVAVTPSDVFESLVCDLIAFLPDQTRFVWVLDQLEQFFTLGLTKEADAAFIHLLRELQARGIWIVATFRNDFYSDLKAHDGISNIFDKDGTHDLEKPGETAIERIIQAPAELARLEFEKDDQTSELLSLRLKNDAITGGKDILPLLEFALDQLYKKRELKNGRTQLTWAAYEAMGGLQGAIGNRADEVLSKLDPAAQETLGRVLRALAKLRRDTVETESGKSTFIASVANIENFPADSPARRLIDAFADKKARLFIRDSDNQGIAQVRVTHEALFTHWSKAREILKDSMKDMVVRDRLADNEVDWRLKEKHASKLLPSGLPLEEAQDLLARRGDEKFLSPEIIHYIEQSSSADQERKLKESEAQRRKTRLTTITAVFLGILLIVAAGAGYFAYQSRHELKTRLTNSYFDEGAQLVEDGHSKEALAYLGEAMRLDSNPDTPAARLAASLLLSSKQHINISTARIPCHSELRSAKFSPDGRWILTACGHIAQVWDVVSSKSLSLPMQHGSVVNLAEFSSDGRWVITASWDQKARVWEAATGLPVFQPINHKSTVSSAQFSPSSHLVITASTDKTIQIWETVSGSPVLQPIEHETAIQSVQFSPDGRWIATNSDFDKVRIWETATGRLVMGPIQNEGRLPAIFSPDGCWVATVSTRLIENVIHSMVHIWEVETGESNSESIEHTGSIQSIEFSPDGRWLVTASDESTTRVWDVITGEPISRPLQHEGSIRSAQFSPDGRWIVTASSDKTARVWDAVKGKPISQPLEHSHAVRTARFSPDGRWVITVSWDNIVHVWDAATGMRVGAPMEHDSSVRLSQLSPDGRWVLTVSGENTLQIWRIIKEKSLFPLIAHRDIITSAEFHPDGRWVSTASYDKSARVWDVTTGEPVTQPLQHRGKVYSAKFSTDGHWLATASYDKTARVWDVTTGEPVTQPLQHGGAVYSAQFSKNGRWIVTASHDKTARVWDVTTGEPVTQPLQHGGPVYSAQFSKDGRWIVTASEDKTARIWNAATGEPVTPPMKHKATIHSAQFSPDGYRVVTIPLTENVVQVWEAKTGQPILSLEHKAAVNSTEFSPDGRWLVTSSDGTVRIWDVVTGEMASQTIFHEGVLSAKFSPDGRWVITASSNQTIQVWEAATGRPVSVSLEYQHGFHFALFGPDSSRIIAISSNGILFDWQVPLLPGNSERFTEFLERISSYSVNSKNVIQKKSQSSTVRELQEWLVAVNDITGEERAFIDWWLSDSLERTVTLTRKQTIKERVKMLMEYNTSLSLNEALDYYPGHPMALARLAAATWRETKIDQQDDIRPRVALWANLALKYAPDDTTVRAIAEKVLQDIAQPN